MASATAVTTVGAVTGVAQSSTGQPANDAETTASDATLLADLPVGQQAQVQSASLTQQADAQAIAADSSARKTAAETARKQAAKDAVAKQKAAQQKALQDAKDRQEAQRKASSSSNSTSSSTDSSATGTSILTPQSSYTTAQVQAIARQIVPGDQFQCFSNIVDHESGWNYLAVNPSSGAYGLVQSYPGSKMASVGADWRTNPATQIKWGLNYMNDRYGSPCDAWAYWQANNSY